MTFLVRPTDVKIRCGDIPMNMRLAAMTQSRLSFSWLAGQDGSPVYGGANDPRMGTLDFNTRCRTCDCTYTGIGGNQVNDCPGHFGHMEVGFRSTSYMNRNGSTAGGMLDQDEVEGCT